jgi:transposase-like protein
VKKSEFSESQIVGILKEVDAGAKVGETCRKYGISEAGYYRWKSKYAGKPREVTSAVAQRFSGVLAGSRLKFSPRADRSRRTAPPSESAMVP